MSRPSAIVCVGDVMVDVLAQLSGPLATGSDTPAPIEFRPGGSAANTAAWLAWLGVPVRFHGRIGDDPLGADAVSSLRQLGVVTRVAVDFDCATGVCLVLISPDGERTMVPSAGANARLTATDLAGLLTATDHLHLSAYSLFNPGSRGAALAALDAAVELGASISLDAASAAPIRSVGAAAVLGWLPPGTLLLANTDELVALTGIDGGTEPLVRRGLTVIIKDGPRGARLATSEGTISVPTDVVPVLDSTGAGDAFAAGVLGALHRGASMPTAIAEGNRTGARALGVLGGRPPSGR
jgi:ribokinase